MCSINWDYHQVFGIPNWVTFLFSTFSWVPMILSIKCKLLSFAISNIQSEFQRVWKVRDYLYLNCCLYSPAGSSLQLSFCPDFLPLPLHTLSLYTHGNLTFPWLWHLNSFLSAFALAVSSAWIILPTNVQMVPHRLLLKGHLSNLCKVERKPHQFISLWPL